MNSNLLQQIEVWIETHVFDHSLLLIYLFFTSQAYFAWREQIRHYLSLMINYQKLMWLWRLVELVEIPTRAYNRIKTRLTSIYGWGSVILLMLLLPILPKPVQQKLLGVILAVVLLNILAKAFKQTLKPQPIIS